MTDWLSPKILAPEVHGAIGFGYLVALWLRVLPLGTMWFYFALAVFAVVVAVKEGYWDPANETDQPFYPEGLKDLAFYAVGIAAGLGYVLL